MGEIGDDVWPFENEINGTGNPVGLTMQSYLVLPRSLNNYRLCFLETPLVIYIKNINIYST